MTRTCEHAGAWRRWWIAAVLAFAVALAIPAPSRAAALPEDSAFRTWFERQVTTPTPLPAEARNAARQYRYVFVAGFLNEGFQGRYFNENQKALLDEGVKPDAIHIIFPRSAAGVEETVVFLGRAIPALAARGPQKLVLVGHSKGAVEVLAFVASAAAFVDAHVQAVFLVQGAFGGSGIADYITGSGRPIDQRLPMRARTQMILAARGGKMLATFINSGFQSLTHRRAADLWDRLIPPARAGASGSASRLPPTLAGKIFYIRGQRAPEKVSGVLAATAPYLRTYYGENDGLVEVADQWIPGAGELIATLDADHCALVVARPISAQSFGTRRAFTRALLMQIAGAFGPGNLPGH